MGYAKERGKLEKLLVKVTGVIEYSEKSIAALDDVYENYSHTIRILKNKEPEIFQNLYINELQEVKAARKVLKDGVAEDQVTSSFTIYKEVFARVLEKAIETTKETL